MMVGVCVCVHLCAWVKVNAGYSVQGLELGFSDAEAGLTVPKLWGDTKSIRFSHSKIHAVIVSFRRVSLVCVIC